MDAEIFMDPNLQKTDNYLYTLFTISENRMERMENQFSIVYLGRWKTEEGKYEGK